MLSIRGELWEAGGRLAVWGIHFIPKISRKVGRWVEGSIVVGSKCCTHPLSVNSGSVIGRTGLGLKVEKEKVGSRQA